MMNRIYLNDVPSICEVSERHQDDRVMPWICDASVKTQGNVSQYCGSFTVFGSDNVISQRVGFKASHLTGFFYWPLWPPRFVKHVVGIDTSVGVSFSSSLKPT